MNNLIDRSNRLRMRRRYRSRRKQVEGIGVIAEEQLEALFFKRMNRLVRVRRFVIGWILLLVLLGGTVGLQLRSLGAYYQQLRPAAGGTYIEGMVGSFSNASPLYATGLVDTTVSKLVFAGLLKNDSNNRLIGDLAESWDIANEGKLYTVKLRPNLKWHDGRELTAEDVAFTFQTIQNPDTKSPMFFAWQNVVIKVVDKQTVTFELPSTLAPFIYSLTTGIVPKHKLEAIKPVQLRSASFNTSQPVGAGPFTWSSVEIVDNSSGTNQHNIGLKSFADYHNGAPKLQQFIIKTYANEDELFSSFKKQEINALVGLDRVPEMISQDQKINTFGIPLTAETLVFLRTDSELLGDIKLRQALVQATNVPVIVSGLSYPAIVADGPLLRGQLGYNADLRQLPANIEQSKKLLDESGWKLEPGASTRSKDSKKLSIKLYAPNNPDYSYVTQQIQKAWREVGVEVTVTLPGSEDLQSIINRREYDVLVYGISIGADPDVFAYWHSTQADLRSPSRLNFSNYKSTAADKALEAGRTRIGTDLRAAKYIPFLQSWRNDAPAIALYQPRFLYVTRGDLFNFDNKIMNSASERFSNVHEWMIRQDRTLKSE